MQRVEWDGINLIVNKNIYCEWTNHSERNLHMISIQGGPMKGAITKLCMEKTGSKEDGQDNKSS